MRSSFIAAVALASSACLEPPPGPGAASARDVEPSPRRRAETLWIWNGEAGHESGSGWASCQDEHTPCQARLVAEQGAGVEQSVGLRFEAQGPEWMGFGWNWFGWWPKDAGTDLSGHNSLAFAVKVTGAPGQKPEPHTVRVALGGSAFDGQDATEAIPIADHAPDFADGDWHDVTLPLGALLRGKGERFDTHRAWSFTIGAWNQGERKYEICVDDVRFP